MPMGKPHCADCPIQAVRTAAIRHHLRIVGNAAEAEEAMQDTFLKVFTRLNLYQRTECFEAWMHRIAVHTAIDYVRRNEPQWDKVPENYPESDDNGPDEDAVQWFEIRKLPAAQSRHEIQHPENAKRLIVAHIQRTQQTAGRYTRQNSRKIRIRQHHNSGTEEQSIAREVRILRNHHQQTLSRLRESRLVRFVLHTQRTH